MDYQKAMANIRNCIDDTRPPIKIENKVLRNSHLCLVVSCVYDFRLGGQLQFIQDQHSK